MRSDSSRHPRPDAHRRLLSLLVAFAAAGCGDGPSRIVDPEQGTFALEVRVHLLSSAFAPLATTLTDSEVRSIFDRTNELWSPAAIEWRIESIIREEAAGEEGFAAALLGQAGFDAIAGVVPRERLSEGEWDVYLIRDLGGIAGGIYFPDIPAVLGAELDPSGQRDLTGSIGRILAHELGHSLSLHHVPCTAAGNLMAPGCPSKDRTRLTASQIEAARAQASTGNPYRG